MVDYAVRKEVLFICVEDVLFLSKATVLKAILKDDIAKPFEDSLDLTHYKSLNDKNILRLACTSRYINPVFELVNETVKLFEEGTYERIDDNDEELNGEYEESMDTFNDITISDAIEVYVRNNLPGLYSHAPKSALAYSLTNMLKSDNLSKVYFYSETGDKRITDALDTLYGASESKYEYLFGDLEDVIEAIYESGSEEPTAFILNDIDYAKTIFDSEIEKLKFVEITIGNFGFNYVIDIMNDTVELKHHFDELEQIEKCRKIGVIDIFKLTDAYFTGEDIINNFRILLKESGAIDNGQIEKMREKFKKIELDEIRREEIEKGNITPG